MTITVTSTSLVAVDGELTVDPGGHEVIVILTLGV